MNHPTNGFAPFVATGNVPYVPGVQYPFLLTLHVPPFALNVTVWFFAQCAYNVRVVASVVASPDFTCVPPLAAVNHPTNGFAPFVATGSVPYVPGVQYPFLLTGHVPPFALNVTVWFFAQCAYSVRVGASVTTLSAVTCSPPLFAVNHPTNGRVPFVAAGNSP